MRTTAVLKVNSDFEPIGIDAEWGKFHIDTVREFYQQTMVQLGYFLTNGRSPNPTFTSQEMDALAALLALNSDKTAMAVFLIRGVCNKTLGFNVPYASVNQTLKQQGFWPVKETANKIEVDLANYMNLKDRHNVGSKDTCGDADNRNAKLSLRSKSL